MFFEGGVAVVEIFFFFLCVQGVVWFLLNLSPFSIYPVNCVPNCDRVLSGVTAGADQTEIGFACVPFGGYFQCREEDYIRTGKPKRVHAPVPGLLAAFKSCQTCSPLPLRRYSTPTSSL